MGSDAIVIIGASAAGISAAREIRTVNGDVPVRIFTEEKHYPYYRPFLTEYIGDSGVEKRANFLLNPEKWYGEKKIDLNLRYKDCGNRPCGENDRDRLRGKTLLREADPCQREFAVRSLQRRSAGKKNVYSVRTLDDARAVQSQARKQ